MKRMFATSALFALSTLAQASGGYRCYYDVREWHGAGYTVVTQVSNLYAICGQDNARRDAQTRCARYVNQYRDCQFLECEEDPWLACSDSSQQ